LNNGFVETIAFDRRKFAIDENKAVIRHLLNELTPYMQEGYFYRGVPSRHVIEFIRQYINEDARSPKSQSKPVLNYIDDRMIDGELQEWDVYIAEGDGDKVELAPSVNVCREIRYPGSDTSDECLVVGEKHRLASRGVEAKGLDEKQVEAAKNDFAQDHPDKSTDNTSDRYYRKRRTYPLLVLHPIILKYTESQKERRIKKGMTKPEAWESWNHTEEAYGWSISFPYTPKQTKPVEYVFNKVAIDNINSEFYEDSDDNYEDD
jgi:hypothetical protein